MKLEKDNIEYSIIIFHFIFNDNIIIYLLLFTVI